MNNLVDFSLLLLLANLDNEKIKNSQELVERIIYLDHDSYMFYTALLQVKYDFKKVNFKKKRSLLTFDDMVGLYLAKVKVNKDKYKRFYQNDSSYNELISKYAKYHILEDYWPLCKTINNLYLYHDAKLKNIECYMEQSQLLEIKKLLKKTSSKK